MSIESILNNNYIIKSPRQFYSDACSGLHRRTIFKILRQTILEHIKISLKDVAYIDVAPSARKYFKDALVYKSFPSVWAANNNTSINIIITNNPTSRGHYYMLRFGVIDAEREKINEMTILCFETECEVSTLEEFLDHVRIEYDGYASDKMFGYMYVKPPAYESYNYYNLDRCPYKFINYMGYFIKEFSQHVNNILINPRIQP